MGMPDSLAAWAEHCKKLGPRMTGPGNRYLCIDCVESYAAQVRQAEHRAVENWLAASHDVLSTQITIVEAVEDLRNYLDQMKKPLQEDAALQGREG